MTSNGERFFLIIRVDGWKWRHFQMSGTSGQWVGNGDGVYA